MKLVPFLALLLAVGPLAAQPHAGSKASKPPKKDEPAPASIPGLEETDFRVKRAPLRREGTFLLRQRGSLLKLPGGERAFLFHPDASGRAERPMVLVPCSWLQRIEQIAADRPTPIAFSVTGQVYAYRGVNYLLLSGATVVADEPPTVPPQPVPPTSPPQQPTESPPPPEGGEVGAPPTPPPPSTDPQVQDLIKQLEAQRDRPRTIEPGIPVSPVPPASLASQQPKPPKPTEAGEVGATAAARLIPEGRAIVNRRARMVRTGSDWSVAFDSGPRGDPDLDRPMTLTPCLNLQRMESWAGTRGDNATMEVSGQVLAYQGRNYLIPTLFRITPPTDLQPRQ